MATDAPTLLSQSNCYACFGIGGTWDLLELALLSQWGQSLLMATDPQTLFTAGKCYACYTQGEMMVMVLALLQQISLAKNPANATDPNSLLAAGKCYACYTQGEWELMRLALLAQIAP